MPIRAENVWLYPIDWEQLSAWVRFGRAGGRCERCRRPHLRLVAHLGDGRWWDAGRGFWRSRVGRRVAVGRRFELATAATAGRTHEWPDSNLAAARNVKLATLIDRGIRQLTYTYDMGDDWRHTVTVEVVGRASPIPNTPASSQANGAARLRTSAASPDSSCSSTPSATQPTRSTNSYANGTAARSTPRTSTNSPPSAPSPPSP